MKSQIENSLEERMERSASIRNGLRWKEDWMETREDVMETREWEKGGRIEIAD